MCSIQISGDNYSSTTTVNGITINKKGMLKTKILGRFLSQQYLYSSEYIIRPT